MNEQELISQVAHATGSADTFGLGFAPVGYSDRPTTGSRPSYRRIDACRLCRRRTLIPVLDLGMAALTGVFPAKGAAVSAAPLEVVWCPECTLVQLLHSHEPTEMYGDNYGYRSGLNASMVRHLQNKASRLAKQVGLSAGDVVLDIGCNDGTLLAGYGHDGVRLIGIDPTAAKFSEFHREDLVISPTFFSQSAFSALSSDKAKLITSVAMFYDLEDPVLFTREVAACLAQDGLWHFEQSYMPAMLRAGSYDTVCHEHLEYYSLENIVRLLDSADLEPINVRFNSINGGSFSVTAAHRGSRFEPETGLINWLREQERRMGFHSPAPLRQFEERVYRHRADLRGLLETLRDSGSTVLGYGASTKGNVMLQFAGVTTDEMQAIVEVNPDKYGKVTPGTEIPIVSESEAAAMRPDYYVVLPWHFREGILRREEAFLRDGGRLIFPLPEIEIVGD
jgi:SAM-dependent methyltransferase